MKHLRKFATESELTSVPLPNAVLIADTKKVLYNAVPFGVYVQHIDGLLYTTEEWEANGFANEVANGIAVITEDCRFVMALTPIENTKWSSDTENQVEGIVTTEDKAMAKTDFAGKENTAKIVLTDKSDSAYLCSNYVFPNGAKGYLPALGELDTAYSKKSAIKAIHEALGLTAYSTQVFWSSTQKSATNAWELSWYNRSSGGQPKGASLYALPFTTL